MKQAMPLLTLLDATPAGRPCEFAENFVLGEQRIGVQQIGNRCDAHHSDLPTQTIAMPVLHPVAASLRDIWIANSPCHSVRVGDIHICSNEQLLFGVIEIDESQFADSSADSILRAATDFAYRQIFQLLTAKNYPHLWRVWNYIPAIHGNEAGLERYRQFNIGRQQAFEAAQRSLESSPAASALGTQGGAFSVAFIAGRTASTRIENPRQISAYSYPSQYGPRSPAFSRALTVADARHRLLFVSGTASIVGHETMHEGDVIAQTRESVANVAVLLQQINSSTNESVSLRDLAYRVYIRHAHHCTAVRETLDALIDAPARALYLQADICREDLLVEIEAFAVAPL